RSRGRDRTSPPATNRFRFHRQAPVAAPAAPRRPDRWPQPRPRSAAPDRTDQMSRRAGRCARRSPRLLRRRDGARLRNNLRSGSVANRPQPTKHSSDAWFALLTLGAAFRQSELFWQAADSTSVADYERAPRRQLIDRVPDHRGELLDQAIGNATTRRQIAVALELRDRGTCRVIQYPGR